jgi:hypothetical protein
MTNAREIVNGAAKLLTVLGRGQALSAEDAQNGLEVLNDLLGLFSLKPNSAYNLTKETFNLSGAQSYTIGTGGVFNTTRPVYIESVYVTDGSTDYPVSQVSMNDYATLPDKDAQGMAQYFAYDNNEPTSTIYLYPAPTTGSITIYSAKAITKFADLTTDYNLPDGMAMMLKYNLAVLWAPQFEMEATPTVQATARQTMTAYKAKNSVNNFATSSMDAMFTNQGFGNIYSGWER